MTLIELRRSKDTKGPETEPEAGRFLGRSGAEYTSTMRSQCRATGRGHEVVECARRAARDAGRPFLLAVSGGLDSMVLLDAFATVAPTKVAGVATFDHGTGAHAKRAARLVAREARRRGGSRPDSVASL